MGPHDTIAAVATPLGQGAVGVVRLSGPEALEIARRVFTPASGRFPGRKDSHKLVYGHVRDPRTGELIDEVLLAAMWGPRTYTREDMVEIDCHGGLAAQRAVLRALLEAGARPAEPGEFTRRAFLNGRIDLAQAESVLAIVQARTGVALRAAVRQLGGGLSARLRSLRSWLVGVLAELEAQIDFSDEDPGELDRRRAAKDVERVAEELQALLSTALTSRVLEQGLRVAIVGRPNVGKSSLLNALAMRERAIVSELPGTTRDTVEEVLEIAGYPVALVDTAGLRRSGDLVEEEGVRRTLGALQEADLVLAVTEFIKADAQRPRPEEQLLCSLGLEAEQTIVVLNKADLCARDAEEAERMGQDLELVREPLAREGLDLALSGRASAEWRWCVVSATLGWGVQHLREMIRGHVEDNLKVHLDEPLLASERQRRLVALAIESLAKAQENLAAAMPEEIVAEDIRAACVSIGQITGEELAEDLLDEVFSRFCIGK